MSLLALLVAGVCSQAGVGYSAPETVPQGDPPELVLFLAGSAANPFEDLSPSGHVVQQVADGNGGQVQVVYDPDLNRNVFSFEAGGWLEVLDSVGLLTLTSADELTIEVGLSLTNRQMSYVCDPDSDSVTLPISEPVPDQVVFSKGPLTGYPRNYALAFGWNRDDMRKEYCDPVGYFPGLSYCQGGMSNGIFSPMNPTDLEGWQVHAFRIAKIPDTDTMGVWAYKDGVGGDWPTTLPIGGFFGIDEQALPGPMGPYPLIIGNGYATSGTNPFNPNPFFGRIDYIRIYKGLLPSDELNNDPHNPIPGMPPANEAPVALCRDINVDADAGCFATVSAGMLDEGSYDPDGDAFTLSIDNAGPFTAGPDGRAAYQVTLTATDSQGDGLMSSCVANVVVTDVAAPVLAVSDAVCSVDTAGTRANRITASALDGCSGASPAQITDVQITNNGGQVVRGRGIWQVDGANLFVYPNGTGWTANVSVTATDARGNTATETIPKTLLRCR